jgi:hypothetical protein
LHLTDALAGIQFLDPHEASGRQERVQAARRIPDARIAPTAAHRDREPSISEHRQRSRQGFAVGRTQGQGSRQPVQIDGGVLLQTAVPNGFPQRFDLIGGKHHSNSMRS